MDNDDPTLRLYSHSYRWSSKPGKIRCTLTRKQKVKINHMLRNEHLHPVSNTLRCLFPGFTCIVWVGKLVTLGATSYLSVQPISTSILPRTSSLPLPTSQRLASRSKERHRSNLNGLFPSSNWHCLEGNPVSHKGRFRTQLYLNSYHQCRPATIIPQRLICWHLTSKLFSYLFILLFSYGQVGGLFEDHIPQSLSLVINTQNA